MWLHRRLQKLRLLHQKKVKIKLKEGRGGVCWEKGCFQQEPDCKQTLAWSLDCWVSRLWWRKPEEVLCKNFLVWNPVPEKQCNCWQIKATYGAGVYWLAQALLNDTSTAPWLLVTSPETAQNTAPPAKESMSLTIGRGDRPEKGVQLYPETVKLTLGTAVAILYRHQCKSSQLVWHHWGWGSTSITLKEYCQGWVYMFPCITTALHSPP